MKLTAQTSRQVIDNLLRGKPAERMGIYDNFWRDTLRGWMEQGYPALQAAQAEEPTPVDPLDHFDLDMGKVGGWFDSLPIRGYSEVEEETAEWKVVRNGAGAALKYWKHKSGTPEHIDFRMTSREVWERDYRPLLLELDRERLNVERARNVLQTVRRKGKWAFYGHLFVFENMRRSLGDVCMYQSLLLDPAWIHDYNRVHTDFFQKHYELLFEEAGLPDGVWMYEDLGYKNGLICSPRTLEKLFFPYFKEMVDFFHRHDLPVVLHSCGGVEEALSLIVETGFDALHPMEVNAGCDVVRFAERYADKLAFIGGFDKTIIETHDRDLMRRSAVELLERMRDLGARYVFASDHSISTNVRYDDYKYLLEVVRDNLAY